MSTTEEVSPEDVQQNHESILNNIQSLQQMEQQLFNSLENTFLTEEERGKIVDKINKLSQMRITFYETLGQVNKFYVSTLDASEETLKDQQYAIQIVETEMNKAKQQMEQLDYQKTNQLRL
jgi:SMC interacting uncharacterized protein involved in chromosome segregation